MNSNKKNKNILSADKANQEAQEDLGKEQNNTKTDIPIIITKNMIETFWHLLSYADDKEFVQVFSEYESSTLTQLVPITVTRNERRIYSDGNTNTILDRLCRLIRKMNAPDSLDHEQLLFALVSVFANNIYAQDYYINRTQEMKDEIQACFDLLLDWVTKIGGDILCQRYLCMPIDTYSKSLLQQFILRASAPKALSSLVQLFNNHLKTLDHVPVSELITWCIEAESPQVFNIVEKWFKSCNPSEAQLADFYQDERFYKGENYSRIATLIYDFENKKTVQDKAQVINAIQALSKMGFAMNGRYAEDIPPLHVAVQIDEPDLIEVLVESGADLHQQFNGKTPLQAELCKASASTSILDKLEDLYAHQGLSDQFEATLLHQKLPGNNKYPIEFILEQYVGDADAYLIFSLIQKGALSTIAKDLPSLIKFLIEKQYYHYIGFVVHIFTKDLSNKELEALLSSKAPSISDPNKSTTLRETFMESLVANHTAWFEETLLVLLRIMTPSDYRETAPVAEMRNGKRIEVELNFVQQMLRSLKGKRIYLSAHYLILMERMLDALGQKFFAVTYENPNCDNKTSCLKESVKLLTYIADQDEMDQQCLDASIKILNAVYDLELSKMLTPETLCDILQLLQEKPRSTKQREVFDLLLNILTQAIEAGVSLEKALSLPFASEILSAVENNLNYFNATVIAHVRSLAHNSIDTTGQHLLSHTCVILSASQNSELFERTARRVNTSMPETIRAMQKKIQASEQKLDIEHETAAKDQHFLDSQLKKHTYRNRM